MLIYSCIFRYEYAHGIPWSKTDEVNGHVITRQKRVSITLRFLLKDDKSSSPNKPVFKLPVITAANNKT